MRRIALLAPLVVLAGCSSVQEWYGSLRGRRADGIASAPVTTSVPQYSSHSKPSAEVVSSPRMVFPAPPRVDQESPFYDTIVLEPSDSSSSGTKGTQTSERVPMGEPTREPRLFEAPPN